MAQIIYVLTNEAMPNLVKIGRTADNVEGRMSQLSCHSGVPLPFECYFAAEVADAIALEKKLHQLFAAQRINIRREFFNVEPEKVVLAISIGPFREITTGTAVIDPEEEVALERAKERRPRINLAAIGIQPGAELTLARDGTYKAVVVEGGKVSYNGQIMSLSAAALAALQSLGYQTTSVSGSDYWTFEGDLLDERRNRMEAQQFDEQSP